MLDVIISQGRIGDRTERTLPGAARTGQAFGRRYGINGQVVGAVAQPAVDNWSVSLPQARETLIGLANAVDASIRDGNLPIMIANTCSASLASLPIVARYHPDAVVFWIDAHADFNTPETTESGYLGGMVLSAACGLWESGHGAGLRPERVVLIGARDIDPAEGDLLRRAGVRVIVPSEATPEAVLAALDGRNVWIHVDWDALEPGFVSADYAVPAGLLPGQLRKIFAAIPSAQLLGLEVAEYHAADDDAASEAALSTIFDIIGPLLDGRLAPRT